ncbi:hypothetical protein I568_01596 [Enterococcus columbae DSM 7374 = ATCC 51263]|uniref:Uncharacterized protein n=1 Tax=Enterococcus columbae DSM 7374 = ATCC 51263 TaxID=1121865 RepID=S0K0T3_9ENTE|nr:hypothetical protein OMW_02385 [Enterococcus columbae DSM 7374 = ATCC 51263]EOW83794.1 hypothetical protein I568_01596 [Enterococcus columbae DSM 7374 = ATCC 51263]
MMKFLFGLLYLVFAIVILVQTARTEKKFLYLNEHFVIFSALSLSKNSIRNWCSAFFLIG